MHTITNLQALYYHLMLDGGFSRIPTFDAGILPESLLRKIGALPTVRNHREAWINERVFQQRARLHPETNFSANSVQLTAKVTLKLRQGNLFL